jgi:hypothetical protein
LLLLLLLLESAECRAWLVLNRKEGAAASPFDDATMAPF